MFHFLLSHVFSATKQKMIEPNKNNIIILIDRVKENLKVFGEVLVLHGEVHGALETLVTRVHNLPGQPIQSLLDIQIVVGVVQIVVSKPYFSFQITPKINIHKHI